MTHGEQLHTYILPHSPYTATIEELPIKLELEGEQATTFTTCGKHTKVGPGELQARKPFCCFLCCGAPGWPSSGSATLCNVDAGKERLIVQPR